MSAARRPGRRVRATEADLFLLARVVWDCRNGQSECLVPVGMHAAARRLERSGLIQSKPTGIYPLVSLTNAGEKARDRVLTLLEEIYAR